MGLFWPFRVRTSASPTAGNSLPTRILGKTGVRLPILGFGTAPSGTRLGLKEAVRLYEEAFEQGVTYFDTAPDFAGYGQAQPQLGQFLKGRRQDVFLVTKCFVPTGKEALQLLQRNLKELQTDYVDLVFVHSLGHDKMDPELVFSKRGTFQALLKAKADGLARFVGLSGHNRPDRFRQAIEAFDVDVLLNAVNFVDRHTYNFEERVWVQAARRNIGLIAMKIYGGQERNGRGLSHRMMPSPYLDEAFRYALSLPHVTCTPIGMATRGELHENLRRARGFSPMTTQEIRGLQRIGKRLAGQWGAHFGPVV